eukprot:1141624-Pelagomonas_calceolata.AAC.1
MQRLKLGSSSRSNKGHPQSIVIAQRPVAKRWFTAAQLCRDLGQQNREQGSLRWQRVMMGGGGGDGGIAEVGRHSSSGSNE